MESTKAPTWRTLGVTLLEKYDVGERAHSLHVEKLSLQLFDALGDAFAFGAEERRLLQFAALTHDIGHYIDEGKHHRHSAYLLTADASLDGMPAPSREQAAWLVLNHRKRKWIQADRWSGPELRRLGRLALLLRIADVLDYEHEQKAKIVGVTRERGGGRIEIETTGFPALRCEAKFRRKSSFAGAMRLGTIVLKDGNDVIASE